MVPVQTYQRNHPLLNATIWARVFHTIRLRTIVFVRMDSRDKVVKLASKSVEAHHVKMVASVQQDSKAQTCSTPVDPCQWAHCQNGGSCLRTSVMTYSCACPSSDDYYGRSCELTFVRRILVWLDNAYREVMTPIDASVRTDFSRWLACMQMNRLKLDDDHDLF